MKTNEFLQEAPRVDPATMKARQARSAAFNQNKQPTPTPTAEPEQAPAGDMGAFGKYAQDIEKQVPPSTTAAGGTITPTVGGYIHTANPNNPNLQQPAPGPKKPKAPKQTAKPLPPLTPDVAAPEQDLDLSKAPKMKSGQSTLGSFFRGLGADNAAAALDAKKGSQVDVPGDRTEYKELPNVSYLNPMQRQSLRKAISDELASRGVK